MDLTQKQSPPAFPHFVLLGLVKRLQPSRLLLPLLLLMMILQTPQCPTRAPAKPLKTHLLTSAHLGRKCTHKRALRG